VLLRELAVKLYRVGASFSDIARLVGTSRRSVEGWIDGSVPSLKVSERFWNGGGGLRKILNHLQMLTALQNQILGSLAEKGSITYKSIRRLGMDRASFTRMMERMEVAGWAVRRSEWAWTVTKKGIEEAKLRGLL